MIDLPRERYILQTKMNLLHISDMHFGPRHWLGESELLLEKLNIYAADIVINTGDSTTGASENEFEADGAFLKAIDCRHVISIPGHQEQRNRKRPPKKGTGLLLLFVLALEGDLDPGVEFGVVGEPGFNLR